jgi:hypothetical protein
VTNRMELCNRSAQGLGTGAPRGAWAVPLSVYEHVAVELEGCLGVLARRALGEVGVAGVNSVETMLLIVDRWFQTLVVRGEVEVDSGGGGGDGVVGLVRA